MIEFLDKVFGHIDPLTAYLVIFLSAFTENVVPPIPGDTVVLIGAYLVSIERLNFFGVYLATTLGSVTGFATMYAVGRYAGITFLSTKQGQRLFKEKYLQKTKTWFTKWGYGVILANRFLSGTRSVISIFAGIFRLRFSVVVILALLSSMLWNALLISGGLLLGRNWSLLEKWIARYNQILLIVLIAVIVYFVIKRYVVKRHRGTERQRDIETKGHRDKET
jgi:membrane protein DedA with SNARE-associated domain